MAFTFSEALRDIERKRRLQGVPVREEDYRGVSAGYSESASDTLIKQRS